MARLALSQPEPRGWSAQLDPLGRPFFVHAATNQSVGTHPIDAVYASLWRAYEQLAPPLAALVTRCLCVEPAARAAATWRLWRGDVSGDRLRR